MYYKEETLFEQYPLELTDTYKGRGAVFCNDRYRESLSQRVFRFRSKSGVFSKVIRVRE